MFLIRSLHFGGAERQLVALASGLRRDGLDVKVVSFYSGGELEPELVAGGVETIALSKVSRWDTVGFLRELVGALRRLRPDIIHGYLDSSNLLSLSARAIAPRTRVVWGIRNGYKDFSQYDWFIRGMQRLQRLASPLPDLIIVNSHAGFTHHASLGFPVHRMRVIPNGIDVERFRPDPVARRRIRSQLGIPEDQITIGLPARLDPVKDHETFLRAVAQIVPERPDVRFVCVGGGREHYVRRLAALAGQLGIERNVQWVGERADIAEVYNAFDVATLTSYGEGFSNVVGEAMASGIPCVVTDAGDSARIVGDTGFVVPPRSPDALAAAYRRILNEADSWPERARRARERIAQHFGNDRLIAETKRMLLDLL